MISILRKLFCYTTPILKKKRKLYFKMKLKTKQNKTNKKNIPNFICYILLKKINTPDAIVF